MLNILAAGGTQRPSETAIFTICAGNYLAQASVLSASICEHHPGLKLTVFLIGALPADVIIPTHIELVEAERVFSRPEWNHRRAHYDILEFSTCLKPGCFRFLFGQGVQRAIYLDPDIRAFGRVDAFWQDAATDGDLVLTPHILTALPNDGHMPDDLSIMRAGLYNLGFAAMRNTPGTAALLEWWDAKLRTMCLADVREGVFTDQKWMDYAPVLVPTARILRHLGYNVAYWNLHERTPRLTAAGWCMTGAGGETGELVFFHFSGFLPDRKVISKHENRFGSRPPGDAPRLFADYAAALEQAGHRRFSALDIPPVVHNDGTAWDPVCRALYRQACRDGMAFGDPLVQPAFMEWLAALAPGDHVSRYIRHLLQLRGDVLVAYDDGRNTAGLRRWLTISGVTELGVNLGLAERCLGLAPEGALGVNYVGYLRAHSGIGEVARHGVTALAAAGVAVRRFDISDLASAPIGDYWLPTTRSDSAPPAISILGCNADALPGVLAHLPRELHATYRIGCWYWETPEFLEEWTNRFDLVNEVWAATEFIAQAIRAKATVPVVVMPPMVCPPRLPRDRHWLAALLPEIAADEFVFLFQFDAASVPFRKNPEAAITAFRQAFSPEEPVRLVLKLLNSDAAPGLLASLALAAEGQRISLLDATLESQDRFRLLASADCFVSLHRAEGFGLSIAEAMAYGLPVVTTGWSGNADFTHPGNAAIVAHDLVASTRAHGPYPAGTVWAEPRLESAAQQMRRVWTDTPWRDGIAAAGAETIGRLYSQEAVGNAMRGRLERIARSAQVAGRQNVVQTAGSGPGGVAAGSAWKAGTARLLPLMRDARRYPFYYVARLPRLPSLLWRFGLAGTLMRAESVATHGSDIKRQFRLTGLPAVLVARFRRWRRSRKPPGA